MLVRLVTTAVIAALTTPACQHESHAEPAPEVRQIAGEARRMPAEWEPQAAVWLQWPFAHEGARVRSAFAGIVAILVAYENVHLVVDNARMESVARKALDGVDMSRVTFHTFPTDSSWLRDNGPRYVEVDGDLVVQNWEFDAWGGGFGAVPFARDNVITDAIGEYLEMPVEQVALVHERGDLEVNGVDTAIVSWSVLSQRNPTLSRRQMTTILEGAIGVTSVIYVEGFDRLDGTRGHVDGMLRFVSEDTVVVGQDGSALMDAVAEQIAEQRPDLIIERLVAENASLFMNWLVGDGFVLVAASDDSEEDAVARAMLERVLPGRDVRFIRVDALWRNGGGIHCVTNDQPQGATASAR